MEKKRSLPKYLILKDELIHQIKEGEFSKVDMLPTENELCQRYKVSRVTIRKTLNELKKESYIFSRAGFGTRVNHRRDELSAFTQVESFSSEMKEYGTNVVTFKSTLSICYADESIAETMNCPVGTKLFNLKRVRGNDKGPIVYSDTWLNLPFDLPSSHEFLYGSLYEYLISKGVYFARFEEILSARRSDEEIRKLLNQDEQGIALKRVRKGYDSKENLIEVTYNFYNPELYSYEVEVSSIHKI